MFRYVLLLVAFAQLDQPTADAAGGVSYHTVGSSNDQELLLAFVINRHGERTPDADELSLSNEKETLQKYIDVDGYEGLINVGKKRVYNLGKFIRQRYGPEGGKLLRKIYYNDDIYLRSTDKERTKMTAEIVMSAVYPPEKDQQWNDYLGLIWQPVPYTAVPLSEDYLRFYTNCKRYQPLMARAKAESGSQEFAPFSDLIRLIKENTGKNFTENPTQFQTLFDLFRSQVALGLSVPDWAARVMDRLHEAARLGYKLYYRTDEMKKIAGGVILNDFIQKTKDIKAGKKVTKRFHMYSSHDFNLGGLIECTKVTERDEIFPEYASLFGLELYKNKRNGKYTVVPVYLPQADEINEPRLLHFDGCRENHCDLDKVIALSREFLLTEREYYDLCGVRTELGN